MYDTVNVPTTLRLQYKRIDHFIGDTVPVGPPVAFGECTGWQSVVIKRPAGVVSGSAYVYYRIFLVDANGNEIGELTHKNSSNATVTYSDYWTCYIGRRYHHIFKGHRNTSTLPVSVVVWTAL
ncbi:MAG: hypothetical protein LBP85_07885 [Prevotellaceae bacterium]|jgi:hypothetical protein|nr:hypothetical protein [Prevotellaceae bacterium]